jgi:hypothetical protein
MSKRILLFVLVKLILHSDIYAQDSLANKKPSVIPINEAIDKGMLELKICGAYDPRFFYEVLDREGVHYGKCMAIVLKSNIDSFVILKLDCGTLLVPTDSIVQEMLVTHNAEFPLYPGQTYSTRFYAMCAQLHNKAPNIETTFRIGKMADSSLLKLANYLDANYIQNMLGQHALWAVTDQADFEVLKNYGADSNSILKTKEILSKLNIETKLTSDDKADSKSNEIKVNRYFYFSGLGLLLILTLTTIVLIFTRKRNDNNIV